MRYVTMRPGSVAWIPYGFCGAMVAKTNLTNYLSAIIVPYANQQLMRSAPSAPLIAEFLSDWIIAKADSGKSNYWKSHRDDAVNWFTNAMDHKPEDDLPPAAPVNPPQDRLALQDADVVSSSGQLQVTPRKASGQRGQLQSPASAPERSAKRRRSAGPGVTRSHSGNHDTPLSQRGEDEDQFSRLIGVDSGDERAAAAAAAAEGAATAAASGNPIERSAEVLDEDKDEEQEEQQKEKEGAAAEEQDQEEQQKQKEQEERSADEVETQPRVPEVPTDPENAGDAANFVDRKEIKQLVPAPPAPAEE